MRRRTFLRLAGAAAAGTLLAGGSAAFYANRIEPSWIEVEQIPLRLPRLDSAFRGYRLIQISDLHADDSWRGNVWMDKARMEEVVRLINEQSPDTVVITGDFVTRLHAESATTLSPLRELQTRDGVYAVLGNHDQWTDTATIRQLLERYNINELKDSVHTLRRANAQLHLVGLDDLWPDAHEILPLETHRARLLDVLSQVPAQGAAILLVHEPDFADIAAAVGRFDLQLSGHTHGGQVQLPLHGVLKVPPLGRRYPAGLYQVQTMQHYTNRGIGMVSPHVRFDCRPEISVFTLQ